MASPALAATLDVLAPHLRRLKEPWRLFGSAAMELLGAPGVSAADVDLLVSEADALAFIDALGAERIAGGTALFRSKVFGKVSATPLPVEIMAGFEVCVEGRWRPVRMETVREIAWNGGRLVVPELEEQIALCRLFGREKDLIRAAALESLKR